MRVHGREYGPVPFETLEEWRAEGRLIPQNYLRVEGETAWSLAADQPEIFPRSRPDAAAPPSVQPRTLARLMADTCRIYARGFAHLVVLALLVGVPSLGLKLSLAFIDLRPGIALGAPGRIAAAVAVTMLVVVIMSWPIFIGGLQCLVQELVAGRPARLGEIIRRAVNFWPRIAQLCVIVYGSFLFWTVAPLVAVLGLAAQPSVLSVFVALVALALQVYMVGRLFVNFMFWQQACTLEGLEALPALAASKELARSHKSAPLLQRPLWRGAILASLWLVILLIASAAVELPFLLVRLKGAATLEEAIAIMQAVLNAPQPDAMTIATYVLSSLVNTLLRPFLGIAFVLLYFESKARL